MITPFRNALKVLPFLVVPFAVQAADLTDQTMPVLADPSRSSQSIRQNAANTDLLFQIQQLQQEMQALRNIVEQQGQVIVQLQKDNRGRYLDIDSRLSNLSEDVALLKKKGVSAAPVNNSDSSSTLPVVNGTAKDAYQQAYALVKAQKFDQAITAYQAFIKNYPSSSLLPNAYYWLGELYMVKNLTQEAERVFSTVIETYPESRKVSDASYKLGLVYARYGQMDKAITQMNAVKTQFPKSTASRLASQFLDAQKK